MTIVLVECGVAKHRLRALMVIFVLETRGWAIFIPAMDFFSSRIPDRIYLINICIKDVGLKRPRCSIFVIELIADFWWKMRERGASHCARHSPLIVTDDHQIMGYCCRNMFKRVRKEKKHFFIEYGVAKHKLRALMVELVPKTRRWAVFIAAINFFFPHLFRRPDRVHLMGICTKREGLERPRCSIFEVILDFLRKMRERGGIALRPS